MVVEVTCDIRNGELIPHRVENPSEMALDLIKRVKLYERLASKAIREKSISTAIDCLMAHPLVNSYSYARDLVMTYVEVNKEYTTGWK